MNIINTFKKPIAFVLTLALLFGSMGLSGLGANEVYATTPTAEESLEKAVDFYSSEEQNWALGNWEELLAIYGASINANSGVDLRQWELPGMPTNTSGIRGYLPQVITSLILGIEPSSNVNTLLTNDSDSIFALSRCSSVWNAGCGNCQ